MEEVVVVEEEEEELKVQSSDWSRSRVIGRHGPWWHAPQMTVTGHGFITSSR